MNIGTASERSTVPAKTIRYYESIGLIKPADRRGNNYRDYSEADVQTLRFISRARGLGFSVKEVSALLALWHDKRRTSHDVKSLALCHVEEIDQPDRAVPRRCTSRLPDHRRPRAGQGSAGA
jgi:MerR family transcriptional regulator, copper efflux regulator